MERKYSDLPMGYRNNNILIVQPKWTLGMRKGEIGGMHEKIYHETRTLQNLVHVGTVHCFNGGYEDDIGLPNMYKLCGGNLTFKEKVYHHNVFLGMKSTLSCSGDSCRASLESTLTLSDIQNAMHHMMLKQMVTALPCCNYVACQNRPDAEHFENQQQIDVVRELGTIAFIAETYYGTMVMFEKPGQSPFSEFYDLGITIVPGLDTTSGFDGLNEWMKFLTLKHHRFIEDKYDLMTSRFLGPKPARVKQR